MNSYLTYHLNESNSNPSHLWCAFILQPKTEHLQWIISFKGANALFPFLLKIFHINSRSMHLSLKPITSYIMGYIAHISNAHNIHLAVHLSWLLLSNELIIGHISKHNRRLINLSLNQLHFNTVPHHHKSRVLILVVINRIG